MRFKIIKIFALLVAVLLLCSCGNTKLVRTKEITNEITQTTVVTKSDVTEIEDFKSFFKEFKADFTIPGLLEGVIPQGIAYIGSINAFAITGYYEDGTFPSVIMLVDAKTNTFTKAFPLQNVDGTDYYGHAGGITVSEDYVYITSERTCYIFEIETLEQTQSDKAIKFQSNFKLNTTGAFTCYNDGVLWVGDFIEADDKAREAVETITTLPSGETFYAYCEGYTLKDGLPDIKSINSESNGYIPDYMLAIPEQVQGMAFTHTGKIIFTTSYGRRNNSKLYVYDDVLISDRAGTRSIDEVQIDVLACSSSLLTDEFTAPPMAEGITSVDNYMFMIFESGADKYRAHRGKYPTDTAFKGIIE